MRCFAMVVLKMSKGGELEMKFRDLFLPKIARSNPEVRKKAVMDEQNADILKKVIKNDSDQAVRDAARKRLQRLNA